MEESIDGLPPVSPVPTAPNHLPLTPCVVHPASPSYASTTTATAIGRGSSQSQSHDIDTPVASDRAATGDESTPPPPSLSPSPPHSLSMDVAGSSSTLAEIHTSIPRSLAHRPSLFRRRTRTSGDEPLASPDESLVPIPHVKHRQWKDRIDRILHREGGKAARDEPSTPSLFPRRLDRGRPRSHSAPLLLSIPVKVVSPSPSPYTTALSSPAPSTTELPMSTKVSCWEALPRELKLDVLGWIVPIFREELDIARARDEEVTKERENDRWAGEAGGWRELVRISIVSRSWRDLLQDGQLWTSISTEFIGAENLCTSLVDRLMQQSGPFVLHLVLNQMRGLEREGDEAEAMFGNWLQLAMGTNGGTSLTSIDLRGCQSLSSSTLSSCFISSPHLASVNISSLHGVDDRVLYDLGMSAIHLESLDVSRCPHLDAISLLWLAPSSLVPSETSCTTGIKILKASRLPHLTNSVLVSIFHRFPTLTTLDISHSHEVTDAGIQDLVTCASIIPGAIKVTRRGETRDVYKRLFPQLLHLNLTGCIALTDEGIGWLESCVNNLEVLELAGIGRRIQNGGIVRLFSSTPRMRRIDLEDCTSLGDEVLGVMESWKGLEWVVFNSCGRITDGGIRSLVEKCQTLTTLEVDSTSVEDGTISYFINSRVNYASTVEKKTPTLLSILDCPSISRRPTRDLQHHLRPRTGQRGYLSAPFTYHDPPLPPPSCLHLQECDSRKVVVRSFQNSLEVDRADRIRGAREESSEGMWGLRGRSQSESSRTGCIVM